MPMVSYWDQGYDGGNILLFILREGKIPRGTLVLFIIISHPVILTLFGLAKCNLT